MSVLSSFYQKNGGSQVLTEGNPELKEFQADAFPQGWEGTKGYRDVHFSGLSFYGGCEVATAVMHAYVMYRSHKHTVPTPFLNYVNPNIKRKNKPLKLIIFTSEFYVSLINSAEILN